MCFILSILSFVYAYVSYHDNQMGSVYGAVIVGIFFVGLMINNILHVKGKR